MDIQKTIPLLDAIFEEWKELIGSDYQGYRNHVYRMVNVAMYLHSCSDEDAQKLAIAGVFHDIGIWIENTVDYIEPSVPPAMKYLARIGKEEWSEEIALMIREHHKITPYSDARYPLVEVFRRADLVDFSWGLIRHDVPKELIQTLQSTFPNAGFHKCLAKRAGKWILKHPLNPAPMMKW